MENGDLTWSEFERVDMRVGTIIEAYPFEKARKPAYIIKADFGEFGILKTSAQVTVLYTPEALAGKQVVGIVNFPNKQIANIKSEFLLLGGVDGTAVSLLTLDQSVPNGTKVG